MEYDSQPEAYCGRVWIRGRTICSRCGRKVLNDQLRETFVRWYPEMQTEQETEIERKAA